MEEESSGADVEQEVLQRNFYYSFGMKMQGPWEDLQPSTEQHYLYNGKENNPELGLEWLSFGFREYDPVIARFPSVDPIADNFAHVSPFNYAENRVPIGKDLWGLQYGRYDVDLDPGLTSMNATKEEREYYNNIILKSSVAGGSTAGLVFFSPALYRSLIVNPELAVGIGSFIWGLGTDADIPGGEMI